LDSGQQQRDYTNSVDCKTDNFCFIYVYFNGVYNIVALLYLLRTLSVM